MAHQEAVRTIQNELGLLIEQNNALVAQQKQMGEFLANCKIYVNGLQKENIALLEENKRLKGIAFDNLPLKPVRRPCMPMPNNPYSSDEETDPTDNDDDDDDDDVDDDIMNQVYGSETCWGCQTNQPNQLAHMDKGGCLYCANTDDEDSEGEIGLNTVMDEMELGEDDSDED